MRPEIEEKLKTEIDAGRYIIQLLAALIYKEPFPPLSCPLTWQQIYETAKMHSVESMVFYAAKEQILSEPELYETWNNRRRFNLIQSLTQIREYDRIIRALTKKEIRVLPVKGCMMKNLYPQADYRQMCDLDILIDPESIEHASKIMQEIGYSVEDREEKDLTFISTPYMIVELHHKLFEQRRTVCSNYYKQIWELAVPDSNYKNCFTLKPEDAYIYQIAHLNKHYSEVYGTGIRSILDIAMFWNRYEGKVDKNYIANELKTLGLTKVANCAEMLSMHWFGTKEQREEKLSQPERDMARIVYCSGTYGTMTSRILRDIYQTDEGIANRVHFSLKRAFLPMDNMKHNYPYLEKWPFLYPYCFVHRLVKNRKWMISELRMIFDKQ